MGEETAGPRQRYRQQVRAEVLELAWQQIEEAGASALSLKAIAKRLGITAPALYRYYASRDELLTELILSAYRDLAEVVEKAAGSTVGAAPARLTAIARAIRAWALANTQRYLLLYGTPVPGYHAPPEATALATRILTPVLRGFSDAGHAEAAMRRAMVFWTRLHGVISLEAAGHFAGMPFDPAVLYTAEVASVVMLDD